MDKQMTWPEWLVWARMTMSTDPAEYDAMLREAGADLDKAERVFSRAVTDMAVSDAHCERIMTDLWQARMRRDAVLRWPPSRPRQAVGDGHEG